MICTKKDVEDIRFIYDLIYDGALVVEGNEDLNLVDYFDEVILKDKEFIKSYYDIFQDIISSDREAIAAAVIYKKKLKEVKQ